MNTMVCIVPIHGCDTNLQSVNVVSSIAHLICNRILFGNSTHHAVQAEKEELSSTLDALKSDLTKNDSLFKRTLEAERSKVKQEMQTRSARIRSLGECLIVFNSVCCIGACWLHLVLYVHIVPTISHMM